MRVSEDPDLNIQGVGPTLGAAFAEAALAMTAAVTDPRLEGAPCPERQNQTGVASRARGSRGPARRVAGAMHRGIHAAIGPEENPVVALAGSWPMRKSELNR